MKTGSKEVEETNKVRRVGENRRRQRKRNIRRGLKIMKATKMRKRKVCENRGRIVKEI